ncbi:chromo domain-like protein, partial [Pluteus cervinus]
EGEEEFEVEEVLGSRMYRRKLQYLVKWKGYGIEHNEWIPYQDMHSDRLINEFHKKN